jgi:hypothetical protein
MCSAARWLGSRAKYAIRSLILQAKAIHGLIEQFKPLCTGKLLDQSRGAIVSAASFEVMTGMTPKSTMSFQLLIHSSSTARLSVSITW